MKFRFFILAIIIGMMGLVNVSCSNESEQKEVYSKSVPLTDLTARVGDSTKAWFDSDKKLVCPIYLKNPDLEVYIKYDYLDNHKIEDVTDATFYYDAQCLRPMNIYWYCGGGVYTNGINTYTVTYYEGAAALTAPSGATHVYDSFSGHIYAYTTAWGGTCQ